MRPTRRAICGLIVPWVVGSAGAWAQPSKIKKDAESTATMIRPVQLDVLSLQVTRLPHDQFGHGIKPGTNENVAFWLANSGTATDMRIKLDRPIARFDESASRLIHFADDKDGNLMRPPAGVAINTIFADNKPIIVKPRPGADEAEVILRGYGTPTPGATRLKIRADLVFLAGSEEKTAERKGLEPTPGTWATIGPLRLRFKDPQQARPVGLLFPPRGAAQAGMQVAFDYERLDRPIKSVTCLSPEGQKVHVLRGDAFHERGGGVWFGVPEMSRIHMRVVYSEKAEMITVLIRLDTGVGF